MSQNLNLQKTSFTNLLNSLAKINDAAILTVKEDKLDAIVSTADNSMFLWGSIEEDFDITNTLNLPSLTKMAKALAMIPDEDIKFKINSNNLEYKGSSLKFKYHLFDDGILNKPKLSLDKINSFTYDIEFEISKDYLRSLLKKSAVFNSTNKLYLYTEDDKLVWSLADKTLANTDTLTIIGDDVDFELDSFILNLDNMRLLSFGDEKTIKCRLNSKLGVGNFQLKSDGIELNYIVSSLTK